MSEQNQLHNQLFNEIGVVLALKQSLDVPKKELADATVIACLSHAAAAAMYPMQDNEEDEWQRITQSLLTFLEPIARARREKSATPVKKGESQP